MAVFHPARGASLVLLLLIASLYIITIALASWLLNKVFESGQIAYVGSGAGTGTSVATIVPTFGNVATPFLAFATLISGMVGLAAVFLGLQHVLSWTSRATSSANSATMIAWLLSLLTMGLACKEIHLRGARNHRMRWLEALDIILPWVVLLQLALLHAAMMMKRARHPHHPTDPLHGQPLHGQPVHGHTGTRAHDLPRQTV